MEKNGPSNRVAGRVGAALALVILAVGHSGEVAAVERGRWPSPTYFSVVARPGDTVGMIAARYRASPSLVAKLNGLNRAGHVSAGQVALIPAITKVTREAVLSEALDRSAPNYAMRPAPLVIAHSPIPLAGIDPSLLLAANS